MPISVPARLRAFLLYSTFAGTLALAACGGGSGSNPPPPQRSLTSISVTPASPSVAAGFTKQFAAAGTYSDGSTANLTSSATWSSDTPSVATVNASGLVTAKTQGSAIISATSGTIKGSSTLAVTAPTVVSLSISPLNASIQIGPALPQQFSAIEIYSDQSTRDVTASSTWAVANPWIAAVDAGGAVSAKRTGYTALTAVDGSLTASANVTVVATPRYLYVSSDAVRDLTRMVVNGKNGQPRFLGYQRTGNNNNIGPGCLSMDPSGQHVYLSSTVFSNGGGSFAGLVNIYSVDAAIGQLEPYFKNPFQIADPIGCFVFEASGKFAYATTTIGNGGNALDTFSVNQDGTLTLTGTVTLPETPGPPAIDPLGTFLYVPTQYTTAGEVVYAYGYTINSSTGALTPIDTTPFVLPSESSGSFTFHPSGKFAYLSDSNSGTVTEYILDQSTGKLSPANAAVRPCINALPLGFSPDGTHAYLPCHDDIDHSLINAPLIAFSVGANGALTQIGTAKAGVLPGQMAIDPSGKFIYLLSSGSDYSGSGSLTVASNVVMVYRLENDGTVTFINQIAGHVQSQSLLLAAGPNAVTMTPAHAYITSAGDGMLTSYNVAQDGTLNPQQAIATLTQPFSPSILPWGSNLLLASPSTPFNMTGYAVNNGALSQGTLFGAAAQPGGIVIDPSGRLAFGADASSGLVYEYAYGGLPGYWSIVMTPSDNQTPKPLTYTAEAGAGPAITDPAGRYLIVANQDARSISLFEYQGAAPIPPISLTYTPLAIAMDPTGNWLFVCGDDQKLHLLVSNGLGFLADSTSGSLPGNATSIAVDPGAHFVYTAGPAGLTAFSINPQTLALSPINLNLSVSLSNATGVYLDPSGQFLYVPVSGSVNALYLFTVNSDGTLSSPAANPVATPNHATGMAFDEVVH